MRKLWAWIRVIPQWIGLHGALMLLALLVLILCIWGLAELADEVMEGEADAFDHAVVQWVAENRGPTWLREMGRDATALGGFLVMGLVTGGVALYLLLAGRRGAMWLIVIATGGAWVITWAMKELFARDRPAVDDPLSYVSSASFPSGHAMIAAAVYLTLGALLARIERRAVLKAFFLVVAIFLTGLVGLSRLYVGVHYPTDILAGWAAGLAWALICWMSARLFTRRIARETDAAG